MRLDHISICSPRIFFSFFLTFQLFLNKVLIFATTFSSSPSSSHASLATVLLTDFVDQFHGPLLSFVEQISKSLVLKRGFAFLLWSVCIRLRNFFPCTRWPSNPKRRKNSFNAKIANIELWPSPSACQQHGCPKIWTKSSGKTDTCQLESQVFVFFAIFQWICSWI